MKRLRKLFAIIGVTLIIAASGAFGSSIVTKDESSLAPVEAATATTYTQSVNADGFLVNAPDAYEPASTYDTIGLDNPQEMFINTEEVNGVSSDIVYILNNGKTGKFITKMNLSHENPQSTVEHITLPFSYLTKPTGMWIQKIDGIDYLFVCDEDATTTIDTAKFTYKGFIYVAHLQDLSKYSIITEPVVIESSAVINRAPEFGGQDLTRFAPQKISVDKEGKIYIASPSTSSGMILISSSYLKSMKFEKELVSSEFISFFAVNNIEYSMLYYLVKTFGNKKQLEQIEIPEPVGFNNVFVDSKNLVYSMTTKSNDSIATAYPSMTKHKTDGSAIYSIAGNWPVEYTDITVTKDGLVFMAEANGIIAVYGPGGEFIYLFGSDEANKPDIVGFFTLLIAIAVDNQNRIWALDQTRNLLQSFNPTNYTNAIFDAMISFENHEYERSRKAWEEVLTYDELSVFANDGLGKAYYYDLDFDSAAKYFTISKNRSLYSEAFWEIRNSWLQSNLSLIVFIAVGVIAIIVGLAYLFKTIPSLINFKKKVGTVKEKRWYKDLTVGFRLITKPVDTFYELKTNRRGSFLGATLYYILGLIIFTWYMYGKALPFQHFNENTLNAAIVIFGYILVLFIFILSNYLVSAIKDGEGTFMNIYKFTGYSLLPLIICLPIATGVSYVLTLTEQVIMDLLWMLGMYGSIFLIVLGILETHNYTFKQTFWNIILTIIFMILIVIVCLVVLLMLDQVSMLLESIFKEVKLRAGWY